MSRKLLVETSEEGRRIIDYASLTDREIGQQIKSYEKKYRTSYARYSRQFDCDSALPWEPGDLIDWECLVEEWKDRAGRFKKPGGKKREMAYQKR